MDLQQLREAMKNILSVNRYKHTSGVEEVAFDLALIYGYDTGKASISALLHDCAKPLTDSELLEECRRYHLAVSDTEKENVPLLHAKVGAALAEHIYEVEDEDILNAIRYHTTGRPGMSLLEKIIFTADYIEPYRKPLPRIDAIRRAAYNHLDTAVTMILENTLNYLNEIDAIIDKLTNETYDYYGRLSKHT